MAKARTSHWLTEVRTVHSRAVSALDRLDYLESDGDEFHTAWYRPMDPQHAEIRAALEAAIAATERFSKEAMSHDDHA